MPCNIYAYDQPKTLENKVLLASCCRGTQFCPLMCSMPEYPQHDFNKGENLSTQKHVFMNYANATVPHGVHFVLLSLHIQIEIELFVIRMATLVAQENNQPKNRVRRCQQKIKSILKSQIIYPSNGSKNWLRILSMKLRSCSLSWRGRVILLARPFQKPCSWGLSLQILQFYGLVRNKQTFIKYVLPLHHFMYLLIELSSSSTHQKPKVYIVLDICVPILITHHAMVG